VWVLDLVQHTESRVTFDTIAAWPVWSPDSRWIAYTRIATGGSAGPIFVVPADGSGPPAQVVRQAGFWKATGFEPGGRGLVFSGFPTRGSNVEIWRVSTDSGATPVRILVSPFDNGAPSLSPDGRWLAYVANESGRREVYVRPYPGPGGRWQVSLDGGTEPLWSPSGKEIFYRSGDAMMTAAVRTQPSFEVTARTRLFTAQYNTANFLDQNYSVSRDGGTFIMLQGVVGSQQAMVVTLNWFDQFRARRK
jgi:Tol biopolymer transport system component